MDVMLPIIIMIDPCEHDLCILLLKKLSFLQGRIQPPWDRVRLRSRDTVMGMVRACVRASNRVQS